MFTGFMKNLLSKRFNMNYKKLKHILLTVFTILLLSVSLLAQVKNDDKFSISYDEESDKTAVILSIIKLPNNADSFSVGAFFEFKGKELKEPPCCVGILMKSGNKDKFVYKDNHNLIIWADKEKMEFGEITWRESPEGFALMLAKIAFLEDMLVGVTAEQFFTIANAKKVEVQIGDFKFELTDAHLKGFQELAGKMKDTVKNKPETQKKINKLN
ncbi:hypothetical protein BH20ACI4_BH20ACI4_29980 [soil metagenome]